VLKELIPPVQKIPTDGRMIIAGGDVASTAWIGHGFETVPEVGVAVGRRSSHEYTVVLLRHDERKSRPCAAYRGRTCAGE